MYIQSCQPKIHAKSIKKFLNSNCGELLPFGWDRIKKYERQILFDINSNCLGEPLLFAQARGWKCSYWKQYVSYCIVKFDHMHSSMCRAHNKNDMFFLNWLAATRSQQPLTQVNVFYISFLFLPGAGLECISYVWRSFCLLFSCSIE